MLNAPKSPSFDPNRLTLSLPVWVVVELAAMLNPSAAVPAMLPAQMCWLMHSAMPAPCADRGLNH